MLQGIVTGRYRSGRRRQTLKVLAQTLQLVTCRELALGNHLSRQNITAGISTIRFASSAPMAAPWRLAVQAGTFPLSRAQMRLHGPADHLSAGCFEDQLLVVP